MDFVDWTNLVFCKIVEAVKVSSEARLFGCDIYSLAQIIFPKFQENQLEFWATTHGKALNYALNQLEQINLIWNGPQPGGLFHVVKNSYHLAENIIPFWEETVRFHYSWNRSNF